MNNLHHEHHLHSLLTSQSLEALDNGKPFTDAYLGDLAGCLAMTRYFAGWCDKVTGQTIPVGENSFWQFFMDYSAVLSQSLCRMVVVVLFVP